MHHMHMNITNIWSMPPRHKACGLFGYSANQQDASVSASLAPSRDVSHMHMN